MAAQFAFDDVVLAGIESVWPDEVVTSADIETALGPLYERLRLPAGRLELITGIRERRVWPAGMLPGEQSVRTAERLLSRLNVDRARVGMLIHGSVCRDYLEPATASGVHHGLGLSPACMIYDVSNACLGLLNGAVQVAAAIQAGWIELGVVVGTEQSRPLMETTIAALNRDPALTRDSVKQAIASLTIGSGSAALLIAHRKWFPDAPRFVAGTVGAATEHHRLCHSGRDEAAGDGMAPLMTTDSERLMHAGIALGAETFRRWTDARGWTVDDFQKTVCHQVGPTHRKALLAALEIPPERDYAIVERFGNTGSTALPATLAAALEDGHIVPGDRVGLLGIGSGINTLMLALEF
ncbi:MAG: 3-oxoacyl-ACP synthase III [Pirellulales bacterium]